MRSRVVPALLAILGMSAALLAGPPPARGDEPALGAAPARTGDPVAAEELDRQARAAFAKGDTRAAAYAFEESARLFEHPSSYFNAARAWERAGEPARAAGAYQRALSLGGLDEPRTKQATERLAELEATLGTLSVSGPPGARVTVGHLKDADLPVKLHLGAGEHRVEVRRADGTPGAARTVTVAAGAAATLEIPGETAAPPPPPPPPPSRATRAAGVALLGASVLSAGAAAVMGGVFLEQRARITDPALGRDQQQTAHDAAVGLQIGANVAVVSAVVFAGAGLTLVLVGSPRARPPAAVTLRPGGVTFTVSF